MTPGLWSQRFYPVIATVAWWGALNAMWIAFTVLGGVVFGIGPATVTACVLTRRRMRGDRIALRDFAVSWRRELVRGSVVVLPVVVLIALLGSNYAFLSALGPDASVPRLATFVLLLLAVAAGAFVGPMYAHYHLPLRSYFTTALRVALARPASAAILLLVLAALAFATAAMPVLLATVSVGAWLHTSTWLCVRFFEENENRLAEADHPRRPPAARALPTEPLRIR